MIRHKMGRGAAFVVVAVVAVSAYGQGVAPTPAAAPGFSAHEYPSMHFSPQEIREHQHALKALPKARLLPGLKTFPATLNLLGDLEYIPVERNQGWCGNCYAWAATATMEMDLAQQLGIRDRLSIQFLNSCRADMFACCGGWETDVADFYNAMGFCVPWSNPNAAWGSGNSDYATQCGDGMSVVACGTVGTQTRYSILGCNASLVPTDNLSREEVIANIKNVLNQGTPVIFAFWLGNTADWDTFCDHWDTGAESDYIDLSLMGGKPYDPDHGAGHMVLCVGYTEDAWIMLNSWGDDDGQRPNGLFGFGPIDAIDYGATLSEEGEVFTMFYWTTLNTTFGEVQEMPMNALPLAVVFLALAGIGLRLVERARRLPRV